MLGKVIINNLNLIQGPLPSIENYFLFIGRGAGVNEGKLITLGVDTDLDQVLGSDNSNLKTQIAAARLNAGQGWNGCVLALAEGESWQDSVDFAMELTSVEGIAITDPINSKADLEDMQAKAESIMAKYMRPLFIVPCTRAPKTTENWDDFQTEVQQLTNGIAADQVSPVGTLWGPELGTYVGRLCNQAVTVADSPMRVATGPLLGNWATRPQDSSGRILDMSIIQSLDRARFSCPQWYPDYPGMYWTDGNVLDVPGGDYQSIENLRVVQKAMRRIYPLAVARIGDRRLNETPASIAQNQNYFMRPLREMSKSRTILGITFPGEIHPPKDGDIKIYWRTKYEVEIYMAVRPYNCPKTIICNILLDLTNYAQ